MTVAGSPSTRSRIVVGIAELKVSADPTDTLVTYALGSCLGVCIHDPVAGVGGLLHAMLPSPRSVTVGGEHNPARFVETGVPALFRAAYALGARKERVVVTVTGGASMTAQGRPDGFQIGKRNFVELKRLLWKNGVILRDQDVGGNHSRTVSLDVATGEVRVRSGGEEFTLTRRVPRAAQSGRTEP